MNTSRYPVGMQSFEEIRRNGYLYVDKTGFIPLLEENKYYFLSRPRRFGKSLLLSMLEAYFKGRKDLFEGLVIYKQKKEWPEYPVLHIDFNTLSGTETAAFILELKRSLVDIAGTFDVLEDVSRFGNPLNLGAGELFEGLVKRIAEKTGCKVVILVDEYDKWLQEVADDNASVTKVSEQLRPFFGVFKTCDAYIEFAMVTGVSRFRNTTLFSGANNMLDISLDSRFATLLGITQQELEQNLMQGVEDVSAEYGWDTATTLAVLKDKYDGYRFTRVQQYVYNPFSLMAAFGTRELSDYWVQTGSSKMLFLYLKDSHFSLEEMTTRWVSGNRLGSTYTREDPLSLLFQTGYLTIREHEEGAYKLGIPNQEVQSALVELVIPEFVNRAMGKDVDTLQQELRMAIRRADVDSMMVLLQSLLSSVPYHDIDLQAQEKHLHLCMYIIFMMLGASAKCEVAHAAGRVDMVAYTPWHVYIFEFKLDGSPEDALCQIDDRGYAIPWQSDKRDIIKVGVNFSSQLRTIKDWMVKK